MHIFVAQIEPLLKYHGRNDNTVNIRCVFFSQFQSLKSALCVAKSKTHFKCRYQFRLETSWFDLESNELYRKANVTLQIWDLLLPSLSKLFVASSWFNGLRRGFIFRVIYLTLEIVHHWSCQEQSKRKTICNPNKW